MKKNGIGGANTQTGIKFENKTDLLIYLDKKVDGYSVKKAKIGSEIYFENKLVAHSFRKHELYKYLDSKGVKWKSIISKKLLPDDAIFVIKENTIYIIEVKYQEVAGSVDEKLQTCDFKRKQYLRLMAPLNLEVEYIYILCDWFRDLRYKDVLDYVISVNCYYYFEYLPLYKIGLPVPGRER